MKIKTFILILLISGYNFAQLKNFIKFSPENGLSTSQISSILQDEKGRLIIGTYGGGLNIYDGKQFKVFYTSSGLCDNTINCMLKDKSGNIWIGTEKGISKFNGKQFINFFTSEGLPSNAILNLAEDENGNILIATYNGFSIYDGNKFISYSDSATGTNTIIWSVFKNTNGDIWLGVNDGILIFNGKNFKKENFGNKLSGQQVISIYKTRDGKIWLGTQNRIFIFYQNKLSELKLKINFKLRDVWAFSEDSKGNIWIAAYGKAIKIHNNKIVTYGSKEGLNRYQISVIFEDREHNLWFGTDDGMYMLRNENPEIFPKFKGINIDAWAINEDSKGTIWIGTESLNLLTYKNGKLFHPVPNVLKGVSGINAIFIDDENNIWLGLNNYIIKNKNGKWNRFILKGNSLESEALCFLKDKSGRVLFGTTFDGLFYFKNSHIIPFNSGNNDEIPTFYSLLQDSKGNIWAGTDTGIRKIEKDSFKLPENFYPIQKYSVMNILEDSLNNLWLGTYEAGLFKYSLETKKFDSLKVIDGLNDNSILCTVVDKEGNLWIGTNKGINKFYLKKYLKTGKKEVLSFNKKDGFLGTECIQNAAFCDSKNNIWIGTIKGLIKFNPNEIEVNNTPPKIIISNIEILQSNFKRLNLSQETIDEFSTNNFIKFPYNSNNFKIELVGVNLTNPSNVKYSYRINNGKWSAPSYKNEITLYNLEPGKYRFEAEAFNGQNIRSANIAKFNIEITVPYWRKTWFLILSSILIMGLVYLGFSFRVHQIKKMNMELEERIKIKTMYEEKLEKSKKELELAKEEAEKSDKLKSEFLAQMSHEIRTPINSILSFSNLIKDNLSDKLDKNLLEGFDIINNSSRRLIRTIDSILNMSRIQTGNIDLKPTKINLCTLLDELILELKGLINSKGLKLIKNFPDKDIIVNADQYTVTQLFANLIDNAVKYTDTGFIKISVSEKDGKKSVIIEDTGIGMTKEFLTQVFNPFTQEETGYTRQFEGNGLGLALVKKYCELNNAEIHVDSEKNKGTKFIVLFS